jgi:hypothetical protein
MEHIPLDEVSKLRRRAARYRAFATRTEVRSVREDRLRVAAFLEREAACTEGAFARPAGAAPPSERTVFELDQGTAPRSA